MGDLVNYEETKEEVCQNTEYSTKFYFFNQTVDSPTEANKFCKRLGGKVALVSSDEVCVGDRIFECSFSRIGSPLFKYVHTGCPRKNVRFTRKYFSM